MRAIKQLIEQNRPAVLLLLFLLSVYVLTVFGYSLYGALLRSDDTRDFYNISQLLIQKTDPYKMTIDFLESTPHFTWQELERAGGRGLYPPSTQVLFIPFFAFLPSTGAAAVMWCLWNIVFLLIIFSVIKKYLNEAPVLYIALLLLLVFGAYATKSCLRYGQTSLFSFAFFLLTIAYRNKNRWLAGVFFAFACAKPSLMILFALYLLLQKEYRIVALSVLIHVVLTGAIAAWIGSSPFVLMENYFSKIYLLAYNKTDVWWIYQVNGISLRSLLNLLDAAPQVLFSAKLLLYSLSLYMIIRLKKHPETVALSFIALMTLIIDFHWHYDFIILLCMYPLIAKAVINAPHKKWWLLYYMFLMYMPNLFRASAFLKQNIEFLIAWQILYTLMYVSLGWFLIKEFFRKQSEQPTAGHVYQ